MLRRCKLDGLQIDRAGSPFAGLPDIITETLADRRINVLVPLDRALFEGKIVPAGFLFDLATGLRDVERFDGSKIFHGEFLAWRNRNDAAAKRQKMGGGAT